MASLGCIVVEILIVYYLEIGNTHIKSKLLTGSYFDSFSSVSIVMFATALLKGNDHRNMCYVWVSLMHSACMLRVYNNLESSSCLINLMYTVYTKQNSKSCEPLNIIHIPKKIMDILLLVFCE